MRKKGYCLFLMISSIFLLSCSRFEKVVMVVTGNYQDVTTTSARISGKIIDAGGGDFEVGHCFDKAPDVSISDPKTVIAGLNNSSDFTSELVGLDPGTRYYVRAYIRESELVVYGQELSFTTLEMTIPSEILTEEISGITRTSCLTGGTINNDGGTPVTERGVCWSSSENPDIEDNKTINGSGKGDFESSITGLTGNTKYYVRAYATNSKGTGYGNQLFFTTSPVEPTVITADPFPLSPYTAVCGGEITDNGGASVTLRGVCWNTNPSVPPTINDHKTTDGGGSGIFSSNPGSLTPDTEYYIRAYATSSAGTGYGPVKTFKTDPLTITDIDGNVYHVIRIGNQLWIKENLKTTRYRDGVSIPLVSDPVQWSNLLSPAYCWYNNASSYKDTYGALYNWYAVNTGKLCPAGWHVPIDAEWTILTNFLGGEGIAGGKMKEAGISHWISPNTAATNESNFTGLPGGVRGATSTYDNMGKYGYHWTNTVTAGDPDFAWGRVLQFDSPEILRRNYYYTKNGFSVRCMRD